MTWGWSHTAEAYANAEAQVRAKDRDWLVVCWSEIQAAVSTGEFSEDEFNEALYAKASNDSEEMDDDALATAIWEYMWELSLCDNGGFNAWACPWGCHTAPFDPVKQETH